jgi:hypothetical protein
MSSNDISGGGVGANSHAHKGWQDIRKQVNSNLPAALNRMNRMQKATLRQLRHSHRVKG